MNTIKIFKHIKAGYLRTHVEQATGRFGEAFLEDTQYEYFAGKKYKGDFVC